MVEFWDLQGMLYEFIKGILLIIVYPFFKGFNILLGIFDLIYSPLAVLTNETISLFSTMVQMIQTLFGYAFPSAWVTLLLGIISINLGFRIYNWLKQVDFLGFSL